MIHRTISVEYIVAVAIHMSPEQNYNSIISTLMITLHFFVTFSRALYVNYRVYKQYVSVSNRYEHPRQDYLENIN